VQSTFGPNRWIPARKQNIVAIKNALTERYNRLAFARNYSRTWEVFTSKGLSECASIVAYAVKCNDTVIACDVASSFFDKFERDDLCAPHRVDAAANMKSAHIRTYREEEGKLHAACL
tara:strand:- start:138 stop:491 length:354 start_codon:yes stop_codon:yes gene_type:complete